MSIKRIIEYTAITWAIVVCITAVICLYKFFIGFALGVLFLMGISILVDRVVSWLDR